jgi:DNA-binding GntR family transcriptional regulator
VPRISQLGSSSGNVVSGGMPTGSTVPSIVTIHQEYVITKTTARKVISALRDEGSFAGQQSQDRPVMHV